MDVNPRHWLILNKIVIYFPTKKLSVASLVAEIYICLSKLDTSMAKTISYFWKPILWLIITCYALFIPASKLPVEPFLRIPYFDKIVHFGLFFTLCIFLVRPFKKLNWNGYFMAALTSIGLSGLLEFIQHLLSSTRQSDIFDFLANTTGVLSALLFFKLFVENRKWEMLF